MSKFPLAKARYWSTMERHKLYLIEHGQDMPEVLNWQWAQADHLTITRQSRLANSGLAGKKPWASGASVLIATILGDLNWAMPINTSRKH